MKHFVRAAAFAALGIAALTILHARGANHSINDLIEQRADHPTKEIAQPTVMTRFELHSEDHTADVVGIESLWANYTFYNDSHNGPDMESLFTDDAVVHIVWNNHGKLVPTFGIHPYQTPDGVNGGGCILASHKDIATYFGFNRTAQLAAESRNGLAIAANSHHEATNMMVKVNDDGKTAMLTTTWFWMIADSKDTTRVDDGGTYRIFLRKLANGWNIADMYIIKDRPSATTECDLDGPIPRPQS